jgi:phenylalanyl-tRNA synthetase alpha chain
MTINDILSLKETALAQIASADSADAVEQARIQYLGRNGSIPALMKSLGTVAPADRAAIGKETNALRQAVEEALAAKNDALASSGTAGRGAVPSPDSAFCVADSALSAMTGTYAFHSPL